jgi:accessory gene regulator protein AgrB
LYKQEAMTPGNEQHKRGLCFDAWYMWLLLINQTNYIPAEYRERPLTKTSFRRRLLASISVSLLTMIFLVITAVLCYKQYRKLSTNHRPDTVPINPDSLVALK